MYDDGTMMLDEARKPLKRKAIKFFPSSLNAKILKNIVIVLPDRKLIVQIEMKDTTAQNVALQTVIFITKHPLQRKNKHS